jgi:hypothetical protein
MAGFPEEEQDVLNASRRGWKSGIHDEAAFERWADLARNLGSRIQCTQTSPARRAFHRLSAFACSCPVSGGYFAGHGGDAHG